MKKRVIAAVMAIVLLGGQISSVNAADISQTGGILQDSVTWTDTNQPIVKSSESSDASDLLSDVDTWEKTAEAGLEESLALEDIISPELEAGENESSMESGNEGIIVEDDIYPELEEDGVEVVEETFEDTESSIEEVIADEEETEEDIFLFAADAQNETYSGTDGNISWSVENRTLTISGTGAMKDYSSPEEVPWYGTCVKDYIGEEEGLITDVVIEDGITSVGNYSFSGCQHLKTVSIANTVSRLGERSFAFCSSLSEIVCTKISEVGDYAFDSCTSLEKIDLGKLSSDGWLKLCPYAFKDCSSLETIQFSSASIFPYSDYTPFIGCTSLRSITFSTPSYNAGYRCFGSYIYRYSQSINSVNYDQCILIKGLPGSDYEEVNTGQYITAICPYAFKNAHNLKKMVVHDDTQTIGDFAFQDCSNLQSVQLGKRLETIGKLAFADCVQLENITIPGCVYGIGEDAFQGCTGLKTVYFRGDVPSVGNGIFPSDLPLTVYYPENNATWTTEVMSAFGGDITWIPYTPELTPFSEEDFGVTITTENYIYDGNKKGATVSQVKPRAGSGSTILLEHPLTKGVNYDIVYEDNVQAGTARVKVCGHGEYSGYIERLFYIQPRVTYESSAGTFDGKKHALVITAEGDASLYFSATTPLTYSNYEESGTTTVPTRISAGTTKVYYVAVPNHNPSEESCVSGEAEFTVAKAGQSITANISNDSLWIGETAQITASAKAGALSFSSDNESIASVDENGVITGVGEGQTKITVTAAETANYIEDSFSLIVSVSPQVEASLYDCEIDVQTGIIYSGMPVEAKVTIYYDGHLLSQGKDYTLQYFNNESPGIATVKINGEGYYIGSVTRTFEILDEEDPSEKSIADCEIILQESRLPYNGNAQIPEVTVKDGSTVLKEGDAYILAVSGDAVSENGDAVDAGTYTLSVIGQGTYSNSNELSFEITQAKPSLSFAESKVEKESEDDNFRNTLTAVTDGVITFFSEDTDVAEVDISSGEVTIKGIGETRIIARAAAGKNYLAGETGFDLTIKEPKTVLSLEGLSFRFRNTPKTFGYNSSEGIPLSSFEQVFGLGTEKSKQQYALWSKKAMDGVCAGIAGSSALLGNGSSGVQRTDFKDDAVKNGDLSLTNASAKLGMNLKTFIEVMHVSQFTHQFTVERAINEIRNEVLQENGNLNRLYETVLEETNAGRPVVLAIKKAENEKYTNAIGHAILAYGIKPVSNNEDQILVYDSNYPLQERVLTIKKDRYGNYKEWAYEIDSVYGTWGTDNPYASISFISYGVLERIWANKGRLSDGNLLAINSMNVTIYDSENITPVASVINGKLLSMRDDIQVMDVLSKEKEEDDKLILTLPVDVYTIENNDRSVEELQVSMTNTNLGTSVTTTARSVTLAVDDSSSLNAAFIDAGQTDTYSVSLNSSAGYYDYDNVVVTGKGNGEQLEVSQKMGYINISNCQILSMSIDGEEVKSYHVKASAGEGGSISPEGENAVAENSAIEFTILPEEEYEIADVVLDGKSVGAVKSYVVENVVSDHEIRAVFKKKTGQSEPDDEKKGNNISAKNITMTSSNRIQSAQVKVSVSDNAPLSFYSNQPSVKVNQNGKVTIPRNYVGMVSIVIKAAETSSYTAASKTVTITVNPQGTTLKKVKKKGSGKATVTWKKNKEVSGYEVSYSTSSTFKNAKTKVIKKSKTSKVTLKKLKRKKYYIRIRTFKTIGGRKYYSAWSKKKTIKIK